jgi:hypothetical protein
MRAHRVPRISRTLLGALVGLFPFGGCASSRGASPAPTPPPRALASMETRPATVTPAPAPAEPALSDDPAEPAPSDGAGPPARARKAPAVVPGPVEITGAFDKTILRRALRGRLPDFQDCYGQALERDPHLSGRLSVKFIITPSGEAHAPAVTLSQLPDTGLEKCVLQVFRSLSLPPPAGMVTARYTMLFDRGAPPPSDPPAGEESPHP